MKQYYYLDKNQNQIGPVPETELVHKGINAQTLVWAEGMADWVQAGKLPELKSAFRQTSPPPRPVTQVQQDPFEFEPQTTQETVMHSPPTITQETLRKRWSWYNISLWSALGAIPFIIAFALMAEERVIDDEVGAVIAVLFGLVSFAGFVATIPLSLSILYKGWENIQDGDARTEPGKAVGFLFIPYYNLYWIFMAYKGLAEDMNKYALERGYSSGPIANEGLAMTACIFQVCQLIPYIGWFLLPIPTFILRYVMMNNFKNALLKLVSHKQQATGTVAGW